MSVSRAKELALETATSFGFDPAEYTLSLSRSQGQDSWLGIFQMTLRQGVIMGTGHPYWFSVVVFDSGATTFHGGL